MKKLFVGIAVLLVFGMMTASAIAQVGKGLSGKHYNLNIIGAPKDKKVDYNVDPGLAKTNGHTLFVRLDGHCKIIMTQDPGGQFEVVDRNGTDGRAEFNIAPGHYDVYATALGKPNGSVHIDAMGEFLDDALDTKLVKLGEVDLTRDKGKPQRTDINHLFYVTVTVTSGGITTTYTDFWVFDIPELLEYYWDYLNSKCKLVQVRFYLRDPAAAPVKGSPTTTWGAVKGSY